MWGKYSTYVYTFISFLVAVHSYTFMHSIRFSWNIFLDKNVCILLYLYGEDYF